MILCCQLAQEFFIAFVICNVYFRIYKYVNACNTLNIVSNVGDFYEATHPRTCTVQYVSIIFLFFIK